MKELLAKMLAGFREAVKEGEAHSPAAMRSPDLPQGEKRHGRGAPAKELCPQAEAATTKLKPSC